MKEIEFTFAEISTTIDRTKTDILNYIKELIE